MSNNKTIFLQQQREAFYAHNIEDMTPKDLEALVGKYKSKKTPEFPAPELIFEKTFAFLGCTLAEFQKKTPSVKAESIKKLAIQQEQAESKENDEKFEEKANKIEEEHKPIVF